MQQASKKKNSNNNKKKIDLQNLATQKRHVKNIGYSLEIMGCHMFVVCCVFM